MYCGGRKCLENILFLYNTDEGCFDRFLRSPGLRLGSGLKGICGIGILPMISKTRAGCPCH